MWAVKNAGPHPANSTWVRNKDGLHQWVVVVKATFNVSETGAVSLCDEQLEPLLAPEYYGDPARSSLRYEADLVAGKPTTDILFAGKAHAPRRQPARKLGVSLRVGAVKKELVVFGSRVYFAGPLGPTLSAPDAWIERELVYEWAYGGANLSDPDPQKQVLDKRNPVGKGVARAARDLIDQPGHCVEYPQGNAAKIGPAGFGPIAAHWSPRLELAGTYDEKWERGRKPLLPLDYDNDYVLCAPADQRPPRHLVGGEPVELINLCAWGPWRFVLPKLAVSFVTSFGARRVEHQGKLATLILEPEQKRIILAWQSAIDVMPRDVDYLDDTTVQVRSF